MTESERRPWRYATIGVVALGVISTGLYVYFSHYIERGEAWCKALCSARGEEQFRYVAPSARAGRHPEGCACGTSPTVVWR